MSKMRMVLRLSDPRADVDDAASETDNEVLNQAIHAVLLRYLGAGAAGSEDLLVELDPDAGTMRLVTRSEAEVVQPAEGAYGPPFYYSYDDLHNSPYVSGPWTLDELKARIGDADLDELLEFGYAEDAGERYWLHSAESIEGEIADMLVELEKVRRGEDLP